MQSLLQGKAIGIWMRWTRISFGSSLKQNTDIFPEGTPPSPALSPYTVSWGMTWVCGLRSRLPKAHALRVGWIVPKRKLGCSSWEIGRGIVIIRFPLRFSEPAGRQHQSWQKLLGVKSQSITDELKNSRSLLAWIMELVKAFFPRLLWRYTCKLRSRHGMGRSCLISYLCCGTVSSLLEQSCLPHPMPSHPSVPRGSPAVLWLHSTCSTM